MLEEDDLDTKLEPVQTCQAGYFEVTHGGILFSLWINCFQSALLLQRLFLQSSIRWNILMSGWVFSLKIDILYMHM